MFNSAKGAPSLSNMFFADDNYVFCKADTANVEHVVNLLIVFERALGQQINRAKSAVFFSQNTNVVTRAYICGILNF